MTDLFFKAQEQETYSESDVLLRFLNSVDPGQLSSDILDSMGWGDGDPISLTIKRLKELAELW